MISQSPSLPRHARSARANPQQYRADVRSASVVGCIGCIAALRVPVVVPSPIRYPWMDCDPRRWFFSPSRIALPSTLEAMDFDASLAPRGDRSRAVLLCMTLLQRFAIEPNVVCKSLGKRFQIVATYQVSPLWGAPDTAYRDASRSTMQQPISRDQIPRGQTRTV